MMLNNKDSRRAVIQVFEANDTLDHDLDVPCTCTMQFLLRRKLLHMFVNMRSNDAFIGLPSDLFAFTMIQEIIARSVDAEVGRYKHCVGSLHIYDKDRPHAEDYLAERWQSRIAMPPMPYGDPWPDLRKVLAAEKRIRNGSLIEIPKSISSPYWADIVNLLRIYERSFKGDNKAVSQFRKQMSTNVFDIYIEKRHRSALMISSSLTAQSQQELFKP